MCTYHVTMLNKQESNNKMKCCPASMCGVSLILNNMFFTEHVKYIKYIKNVK